MLLDFDSESTPHPASRLKVPQRPLAGHPQDSRAAFHRSTSSFPCCDALLNSLATPANARYTIGNLETLGLTDVGAMICL